MSDHRKVRDAKPHQAPADTAHRGTPRGGAPLSPAPQSDDTRLAIDIRGLVERGAMDEARERFAELVGVSSAARRADRLSSICATPPRRTRPSRTPSSRFSRTSRSYREAWPFEVWFTRILINGCLDRRKARARRDRWFVPARSERGRRSTGVDRRPRRPTRKHRLLARERRGTLAAAIDRLDGRQRTVFMLCHYGDCTPREISAMTGFKESTVRVHLFRAARKLRGFLGGQP